MGDSTPKVHQHQVEGWASSGWAGGGRAMQEVPALQPGQQSSGTGHGEDRFLFLYSFTQNKQGEEEGGRLGKLSSKFPWNEASSGLPGLHPGALETPVSSSQPHGPHLQVPTWPAHIVPTSCH